MTTTASSSSGLQKPAQRLAALRQAMQKHGFDAWIIPSADPHLSEYLPEHWQGRRWVSGFTGSFGTLVVTAGTAGLWTDSRYWEQATAQLAGSGIQLQKLGVDPGYTEALATSLGQGAVVGVAPDMLSRAEQGQLQQGLSARGIVLRADTDLLDGIWTDRPGLPAEPVVVHAEAFVSETTAEKLARVRAVMQEKGVAHHLVSSLDDVAWLTNLRGNDVSFNPVFLSHLLIGQHEATLYVAAERLSGPAQAALKAAGISIAPYERVQQDIAGLTQGLLLDPAEVAVSTLQALPADIQVVEAVNPSALFKSIKSPQDLAHVREAMAEDGAALCHFFADFEARLARSERLTELDIDRLLLEFRSKRAHFVSPSFDTIAGFNANAALPHYSATPEQHSEIRGDGMLLIDSGAQYLNGTTDITRVVPVGHPSAAQKWDYTMVLKAHIALAETVFPDNIPGPMLDAICRKPMWQHQCDYGHGTGHGVGYFMNVHEGPQVISYRAPVRSQSALKEGMITSIEPGLYRPGQWGIRIENLVANQPVAHPAETEFGKFLYFEALTLCPIDTRLMDRSLMTASEIQWVNAYHAMVRERLSPRVDGAARQWLETRTAAI